MRVESNTSKQSKALGFFERYLTVWVVLSIVAGINKLARRTVARYRKLLNIPAARFRKKY